MFIRNSRAPWTKHVRHVPHPMLTAGQEQELSAFLEWYDLFERWVISVASDSNGIAPSSPAMNEYLFDVGASALRDGGDLDQIYRFYQSMPRFPDVFAQGFNPDEYRRRLEAMFGDGRPVFRDELRSQLLEDVLRQAQTVLNFAEKLAGAAELSR